MTRSPRALPIAMVLVLAACTSTAGPSPSPDPTATPEPTPTATPEPTPSPAETDSPEPSSSPIEGEGGFTWESNDEADVLMEDTFDCQNTDDGYQVEFPAEWNSNAERGDVPPCSYFAAAEYEMGDPGTVPDEVAIVIFIDDNGREYGSAEVVDRDEGFVGATQEAYRATIEFDDEIAYEYVVALGPSFDEGPVLVAGTANTRGGDFELNKAVLDRMMATMEFIGTIQ